MRLLMVLFLYSLLPLISVEAHAETIAAHVVGVHDGDTITVLDIEKHQTKVRLAEIDAPELDQPYGNKSKQMLSDLVFDKDVTIQKQSVDKYDRTVGRVFLGEIDINLLMVKLGGAWAYREYLNDDTLLSVEEDAKTFGSGLWGLQEDQRIPPWEWRHGERSSQTEGTAVVCTMEAKQCPDGSYVSRSGPNCEFAPCPQNERVPERAAPVEQPIYTAPVRKDPSFTCSGKTVCGQMGSCAEAVFYLTQCGMSRLDGDHDGTPCESICR